MDRSTKVGDAIILAGGFGTRLKSVSGGVPKSLMPVGDRVFLDFVLDKLVLAGLSRVHLSLHYKAEAFLDLVERRRHDIKIILHKEEEPMGTGGAVNDVISAHDVSKKFIVLNGDTYTNCDPLKLWQAFQSSDKLAMVSLAEVQETSRYGAVEFMNGRILGLAEKNCKGAGLINLGMYAFSRRAFGDMAGKFSLEFDLLPRLVADNELFGFTFQKTNFIDIGIPTDYRKFCNLVADNHV